MKKELKLLPYYIEKSGRLIYSEPGNPYETKEVYLDTAGAFIVKGFISEHAPNGGTWWDAVALDEENEKKFREAVNGDVEKFLIEFFDNGSGINNLCEYYKQHEIAYEWCAYG